MEEMLCLPTQKFCLKVCFTIKTAVNGYEGRKCQTTGAAMVAYGRLCSDRFSIGK